MPRSPYPHAVCRESAGMLKHIECAAADIANM